MRVFRETTIPLHLSRPAALSALALSGALITAGGFDSVSRAADWAEPQFDPAPGSHWTIQTTESIQNNADGHVQNSLVTTKSDLAIEQKTADGFTVSYTLRDAQFQGDPQTASLVGPITKAMENVVVHATLAPNGMPVRVDNFDEVLATVHSAIDQMTAPLGNSPRAGLLRAVATRMLVADAQHAPRVYLDNLATLAVGQNTGLHPGEVHHSDEAIANPFSGGPIKSDTALQIDGADPATGKVHYVRTQGFDPGATQALLRLLAEQQLKETDTPQEPDSVDKVLKDFAMSLNGRTEFDVEGGMTRSVKEEDTATAAIPNHKIIKIDNKQTTVAPAS